MKSIIEEASSIAKAIDQAWQRAGKPQEFTVKVFEEAQKSLFGLTVRSAKIALFFNEKIMTQASEKPRHERSRRKPPVKKEALHKAQPPKQHAKNQVRPLNKQKQAQPAKQAQKPERAKKRTGWSQDLIDHATKWLDHCLRIMQMKSIAYETSIIGNNLNIKFAQKVLQNDQKQRMLFSSFAHLMMLSVMQSSKRRLPNLKVILKS